MKRANSLQILALAVPVLCSPARGEGWSDDPELANWFKSEEVRFCCDQRDAYLAGDITTDADGNYVAIITDGSGNPQYEKPAIPNGTKITVPKDKVKSGNSSPGGRGVIFIQKGWDPAKGPAYVYCYWPPPLG